MSVSEMSLLISLVEETHLAYRLTSKFCLTINIE